MKKILLYLVLIMAIIMAGTVAFVSVSGLVKVFAGAGLAGLIFFSAIELAKVVATSAIHTYGKMIGWFYNLLLSLFIFISMAITSLGIYGFLSSSYKETFSKMENMDAQVELLEKRRDGYQTQLSQVNGEKTSVTNTITELSKGLSNNVIQYKDPETGEIITTTSSSTRRALEKQLDRAVERQDVLNEKSDDLSDKVFEIENEITEVKIGDETSSELGPLKYLADVTGMTMDDVMKWFILLLIVIGDPMAVVMVVVFNKVVNYGKKDNEGTSEGTSEGRKDSSWDKLKELQDSVNNMHGIKELKAEDFKPLTPPLTPPIVKPKMEVIHKEETLDNDIDVEIEEEDKVFVVPVVEHKKELPTFEPKIEEPEFEVPSEVPVTEVKEESDKIVREDIKEIKENERGFSVAIPVRKKSNSVDRIGSNKEVRDGNNDVVHFKRR